MKAHFCAALLLAVSASFSAIADDKAAEEKDLKGDLAKLQGTWKAQVGPDKDITVHLTFKGKAVTLTMTMDGKDFESDGEYTLDEKAKPHKTLDFRKFTSPSGEDLGENLGIYEFDGTNTLKVCSGGAGNDRPTEFKEGEGAPPHLVVFEREAEKKETEKKAAAEEPAVTGDLAKFQGKWTTKIGPNKDRPLTLSIKGNAVTLNDTGREGQPFELKGELKLDEKAKPHKTLDLVNFVGPQGNAAPENLAIYEFESPDAIKICSGGPGNERPTEFKAGEGGPPNLNILTREKN